MPDPLEPDLKGDADKYAEEIGKGEREYGKPPRKPPAPKPNTKASPDAQRKAAALLRTYKAGVDEATKGGVLKE